MSEAKRHEISTYGNKDVGKSRQTECNWIHLWHTDLLLVVLHTLPRVPFRQFNGGRVAGLPHLQKVHILLLVVAV